MTYGSHCTHCGVPHTDTDWPKTCPGCEQTTWRNPTPVAVALLPVKTKSGVALLTIRRDIRGEDSQGKLALPGGYVDFGESWQAGCAREVREETQIEVDPAGVSLADVLSPPSGGTVLIFGELPAVEEAALPRFTGSGETSERVLIHAPQELAFPLHTQVANAWFARRGAQ